MWSILETLFLFTKEVSYEIIRTMQVFVSQVQYALKPWPCIDVLLKFHFPAQYLTPSNKEHWATKFPLLETMWYSEKCGSQKNSALSEHIWTYSYGCYTMVQLVLVTRSRGAAKAYPKQGNKCSLILMRPLRISLPSKAGCSPSSGGVTTSASTFR